MLAVKLLGYSRLLRKIAGSNSFDYSVAQVTSKWIAESIQGATDFVALEDPVQGLRDAVSLSSGLGITEIWSTLSVQRPFCPSAAELRSLESAAYNIRSTFDVHGVFISCCINRLVLKL
jgi:midasin